MTGQVESTSGIIGGWKVTDSGLAAPDYRTGICPSNIHSGIAFWAGATGGEVGSARVKIYHSGEFVCSYISMDGFEGEVAIERINDGGIALRCPQSIYMLTGVGLIVADRNNTKHMPVVASDYLHRVTDLRMAGRGIQRSAIEIITQDVRTDSRSSEQVPSEILDQENEYVSMINMCSVMWKAIREQQMQIDALQLQIDALTNR